MTAAGSSLRIGTRASDLALTQSGQVGEALVAGTAHAVLQAVNTFEHHHSPASTPRPDRNMMRAVTGAYERLDRRAWEVLERVLAEAR